MSATKFFPSHRYTRPTMAVVGVVSRHMQDWLHCDAEDGLFLITIAEVARACATVDGVR